MLDPINYISAYGAGFRVFARAGADWHVGLELAGKKNLIHLGNHLEYGVHVAVGYVRPYVGWLHYYFRDFRFFIPK